MVGSRQMERVLTAAQKAGAKVVLVGDPEQLQAIEAGAAFRALGRAARGGGDRRGAAAARGVAAGGDAGAGDGAHGGGAGTLRAGRDGAGAHATQEAARAALVAGWDCGAAGRVPGQSRVMLAYHAGGRGGAERVGPGAAAAGGRAGAGAGCADRARGAGDGGGRPSHVPAQRAGAWGGAGGPGRGRG